MMVDRYETSADSIVVQKKNEAYASVDPMELFCSGWDPAKGKNKKDFDDEQSLSFDPVVLEKEDIAAQKLKGMNGDEEDDNVILKKKLAEDSGEKKDTRSSFDRFVDSARDLLFGPDDKVKDLEMTQKKLFAKKYAQLKQFKELDNDGFNEFYA